MGVTETLRILLTIFLSTACIQNVRLFSVYGVRWPFLAEIHTVPLKRFVPSSVLQAVRALRNAPAAFGRVLGRCGACDVADGFELYSQFRAAIQGMQGYLHQFHFLAMKAGSLRANMLTMCCSVTAWGRSSQKQLQWMTLYMQLLRTEGSPYYQEKFRLNAKNTHANVVTACEERFATEMTAQATALPRSANAFHTTNTGQDSK